MDLLLTDKDLTVVGNDLSLVDGVAAVIQEVDIRLKTFYGEWFLDPTGGVQYFEGILRKKPLRGFVESELRRAILQTTGIDEIVYFLLNFDSANRGLSVEFQAKSGSEIISVARSWQ